MNKNKIKEIAAKYKDENVTNKELLWWLVEQLDEVKKTNCDQDKIIAKLKVSVEMLVIIFAGLVIKIVVF